MTDRATTSVRARRFPAERRPTGGGCLTYDDHDDYETTRRRRGTRHAQAIAAIADRAPHHMPDDKVWAWAEEVHDANERAAARGTGYDPVDEHRLIDFDE